MLDNVAADRHGQLERAFQTFNRLSNQLQSSYQDLERRVAALTLELEEARRGREEEARNARHLAERLELLLTTLPGGVAVVDSSGVIQETNPAAERILGVPLTGRQWQDVVDSVLSKHVDSGGDWIVGESRRVSILSSDLGGDSGRILLLTDVTEMRALEELATRNERLRAMGEMAASLAHQIRTPLSSALLYLSQCRTQAVTTRGSQLLENGIERLHCLDQLVRDMLVFARGHGTGERVMIADLFCEVHKAVAALKPPNAHLIIEGTDVLLELEGNRTALVSALTNLVRNAFEASPDVVVILNAELRGDRVELRVRDNGPGIAPSIQSKVFEPFFSTRPAGTGLGLAVVKTVADAHGGGLDLASDPESGTSIGIELPATSDSSRAPGPEVAV